MTSTFNPLVPTGLLNLSVDYKNLQLNFQQLDTSFGVDHIKFSITPNNGFHTCIHSIPQGAPAMLAGIGQLFTQNITVGATTDTQLFYLTGKGGLSQLTGNSASANGYQWLGGVLFQWGSVTGLGGHWPITDQTVNFSSPNINYNVQNYVVLTTFLGPTGSSGDICINQRNKTNFHWQFNGSATSAFGGFNWISIGL